MKIAVYGSLRRNCYNHYIIEDDNAKYLGDDVINGFALYSLGSYPGILLDGSKCVLVEVYDVSKKLYDRITWMEQSAGYEVKKINTQHGKADIYVFKNEYMNIDSATKHKCIEHGDWVKYLEDEERAKQEDKNKFLKEQYEKIKSK